MFLHNLIQGDIMRIFLFLMLFSTMTMAKDIILTKDNTIVLNQEFSGASVSKLISDAKKIDSTLPNGYPIYLFLDTPGGSIQAGLELMEAFKGLNRPIHTVVLFAASMGFQLTQNLGDRYILKFGILMSHKAHGGFEGEFGGGLGQLDSRYGMWIRRIDLMDKQTVKRTKGKKTLEKYRSEYENELWLNGEEAVKNGYADEVVTAKCDKSLSGTTEKVVRLFDLKVHLELSECPIVTYPVNIRVSMRTNRGYMDSEEFLEKGGKFGKNCVRKDTEEVVDAFYGKVLQPSAEAELCALDEELDLDKIEEAKEQAKDQVKLGARKPVYMRFTNKEM